LPSSSLALVILLLLVPGLAAAAAPKLVPLSGDWNNDGRNTIGVYNSETSKFFLKYQNDNAAFDRTFKYGQPGWYAISGDWNGDGIDTIGLYNPANSRFFLRNNNSQGKTSVTFRFGQANWVPIAGDWNGTGRDSVGVFNPNTGRLFLKNKLEQGPYDYTFKFGQAGWQAVAGDWDGDGVDTVGVYNPATNRFFIKNSHTDGASEANFKIEPSGSGWLTIAGDWNKDGYDSVGTYDPGAQSFMLKYVASGGTVDAILDGSIDEGGSGGGSGGEMSPILPGFDPVAESRWDETAVRKVLDTFAYGGQAEDVQIALWADMPAREAIMEMLTFDEHNRKLSKPSPRDTDNLAARNGTLKGLSDFWSSNLPANPVYYDHRRYYTDDGDLNRIWAKAATSRGLNPFRQRIGFWETNYHMAVNQSAGVPDYVIMYFYDGIMNDLASGMSYDQVLANGAASAAIALQYGHRKNAYQDGECRCNEDFAREFHQLFFGILGNYNPTRHETVTIKNTAKALTDMPVPWLEHVNRYSKTVLFGTDYHYPGTLSVLEAPIGGTNALQRIRQMARVAIRHPESLANLPVKIIEGLADDNLNAAKKAKIRSAWSSMAEKNLLNFLRAYAVSKMFHLPDRVKLHTSFDRYLMIANKMQVSNEEGYLDLYGATDFYNEDVQAFRPKHNVFGGQTGTEAADSTDIFQYNWRRVTDQYWRMARYDADHYDRTWIRDWSQTAPVNAFGTYVVSDVAAWLWQRLVGDGLKNFGPLERAYVVSLLASDRDLNYLLDYEDLGRVITSAEAANDPMISLLIDSLARQPMLLDSYYEEDRKTAHTRLGNAINFILGTPYIFAQEGR
jgi:ribosomal protein S16